MIAIEQLRYVLLGTSDLAGAAEFAQRTLGLEPVDRTASHATFRSDGRDHTLAFLADDPALQAVGFEVREPKTLDVALDALRARGIPVEVVPGVTAMSGCWSLAGMPIVQGDDVFVVVPAMLKRPPLKTPLLFTDDLAAVRRKAPTARRTKSSACSGATTTSISPVPTGRCSCRWSWCTCAASSSWRRRWREAQGSSRYSAAAS